VVQGGADARGVTSGGGTGLDDDLVAPCCQIMGTGKGSVASAGTRSLQEPGGAGEAVQVPAPKVDRLPRTLPDLPVTGDRRATAP
jgi:hypothetical protein